MSKHRLGNMGDSNAGSVVEREDRTATEYERVGGIDLNQSPDTECSNVSGRSEAGEGTEYEGCAGTEHFAPPAETGFRLDALSGI